MDGGTERRRWRGREKGEAGTILAKITIDKSVSLPEMETQMCGCVYVCPWVVKHVVRRLCFYGSVHSDWGSWGNLPAGMIALPLGGLCRKHSFQWKQPSHPLLLFTLRSQQLRYDIEQLICCVL